MLYEIIGKAGYEYSPDKDDIVLPIRFEFEATNIGEAMKAMNQVLVRERYANLNDGTLSLAHPWEWMRVELRKIEVVAKVDLKESQPARAR